QKGRLQEDHRGSQVGARHQGWREGETHCIREARRGVGGEAEGYCGRLRGRDRRRLPTRHRPKREDSRGAAWRKEGVQGQAGGALDVKDGNKIIPPLNALIDAFTVSNLPVCFTRDWHPPDHCSFRENGGPWPSHCVRKSTGAEFHPDLRVPENALVVSKATEP